VSAGRAAALDNSLPASASRRKSHATKTLHSCCSSASFVFLRIYSSRRAARRSLSPGGRNSAGDAACYAPQLTPMPAATIRKKRTVLGVPPVSQMASPRVLRGRRGAAARGDPAPNLHAEWAARPHSVVGVAIGPCCRRVLPQSLCAAVASFRG
jgi:hypothetical protein